MNAAKPNLAFVDTETTGLDADRHEIWEVGLIVDGVEWQWLLPVDLGRAEPIALRIGGWHERHHASNEVLGRNFSDPNMTGDVKTDLAGFATAFAGFTRGRHLVGAVISFDEERLRKLLKANGACPEWHYHLVDVEALAAGKLGQTPPWDSNALSLAVGVNPDDFDRHTALGDARWAKAIYEACVA